ncbi:MAG TPA: HAMP domain-containing sensor histidine kinase [Marmoricola sp.]|nr:HAMP domain-containing sensor histidine kinase [Marmoricola sp.]
MSAIELIAGPLTMREIAARGRAPIVVRLVVSVLLAMLAVSLLGGAFVFWRVDIALNAQLDQDLRAYRDVGLRSLNDGDPIPHIGNFNYQIFDRAGQLIKGDLVTDVAGSENRLKAQSGARSGERGGLFSDTSYIWLATPATYQDQRVVLVVAINRHQHDEALRELLAQLAIAGGATLIAAGLIGYRTARAALDPVERYRVAAETADHSTRLPVDGRDDELTRLGHTFNAFLDRLEASRERERRFLADASHELRAPLSVMRAEVEVALMRAKTSGHDPETLQSLGTQIGRLERLCNALLELEEVTSSTEVARQSVLVDELLTDLVDRARMLPGLGGRSIRLVTSETFTIEAHPHWLEVAINNLVTNAIRYGAGDVEVGARQVGKHSSRRVEIWVLDHGEGLPDDFLPRAFDRFARVDESRASGGTGLGLSIVAEIADLHGGSVRIDGARVSLVLPQPDAVAR